MNNFDHIPTEKIKNDIEDTRNEIFDINVHFNMTEKIQEYRREQIRDRQEFIVKLQGILIERGEYK